jgi:hypothetical protein
MYQGHLPNASPIQRHSVDDSVFPYVIIYRAPVSNAWFIRTPSGTVLPTPYDTHQQAEAAIKTLKYAALNDSGSNS